MTIFNLCCLANFVNSGTRAIVPSSFMISQITPAGIESGQPGQIHGAFGLPRALQHTALLCFQRENMAGPRQVAGLGFRIDRHMNRRGPIRRRNARRNVPCRASMDTVKAVPNVAVFSTACCGRWSSSTRCGVSARQINPRACGP